MYKDQRIKVKEFVKNEKEGLAGIWYKNGRKHKTTMKQEGQ